MYFGLHNTRKIERDNLIAKEDYQLIDVSPLDIHGKAHKPIVWEEDSGNFYEHDITAFLETLKMMERGKVNVENTPYFEKWKYKGTEIHTRLGRLPALVNSIKEQGILEPIDVEETGERLDGSFRSKIALHLGIPSLKARLHKFDWRDIDEDFIERKLKARGLSSGKDYYEFEYGHKDWKNIRQGGQVYRENATDRWFVLKDLVKGRKILDLGCNEGYHSIKFALKGKEVHGVDHDWTHIANLNRLIFEFVNKKDLPVTFEQNDIMKADVQGYDDVLLLNVLYHLNRADQIVLLYKLKGSRLIFQCNLRKERERETYYTSHPDDLKALLKETGYRIEQEILFRDKPIIIAV